MRDFPHVKNPQIIPEAGRAQETCAMVADHSSGVRAMRLEELSQEIEYAGADLGDVAENAENILDVLGVRIK